MDHRAPEMAERWAAGETLDSIGASYGITRERVRQVVKRAGLTCAEDARRARQAQRESEREHKRALLRAWLDDNPGRTKSAAAQALGINEDEIGSLLGLEAQLRFVPERATVAAVYSDDNILAGLRQAASELGNPLAADRYDEYFPTHGMVSSVRVIQRFGTWNAACVAAGLRVNPGRPAYTRRWTEGQMMEHVADYLQSSGCRGTYDGYDEYARVTDGAPSAQTVRNAFRDWANAKASAQQIVAARERRTRTA